MLKPQQSNAPGWCMDALFWGRCYHCLKLNTWFNLVLHGSWIKCTKGSNCVCGMARWTLVLNFWETGNSFYKFQRTLFSNKCPTNAHQCLHIISELYQTKLKKTRFIVHLLNVTKCEPIDSSSLSEPQFLYLQTLS